jgi:MATE family multidrug resistance protein
MKKMSERLSRERTVRELATFALPVIAGQLGLMLIGAGDMMVATKHSTTALAAIGLAVAFANPVFVVGLAFQFSLSPLIARRRGEGHDGTHLAASAVAYALMLSLPFMVGTWLSAMLVPLMGYDKTIEALVMEYIRITAWSIPGAFIFTSLREWTQAHERTWWPNFVSILAVGVNLALNWALCFGAWGFPKLEVAGLAWASLTVRYLMGLALLAPLVPALWRHLRVDWGFLREVLRLGGPTAVAMFFEVMAFCSVTMLVGHFGEVQTAANSLALTLASCTFMVPMGLASAVGVKVGHAFGEKNGFMVRRFAWTGLAAAMGFMALSATVFALVPEPLLAAFGAEAAVLAFGVKLLFWVAIFQVFDGAQVTLGAILRGVGVARPVSIVSFVGYWVIGLPLGCGLAHHAGMEGQGFWVALATSLGLVSVALFELTRRRVAAVA